MLPHMLGDKRRLAASKVQEQAWNEKNEHGKSPRFLQNR
jgi:hypothetical protein